MKCETRDVIEVTAPGISFRLYGYYAVLAQSRFCKPRLDGAIVAFDGACVLCAGFCWPDGIDAMPARLSDDGRDEFA